jgi:glycosyltransferase involved in cell wall biosynthesis
MKINLIKYGDFNDKIFIIPQSVHPKINLFLSNQNVFNDIYLRKKYEKVYLFLGNLRPIKDPFYLKNVFDYLYQTKGYLLVFIGDIGEYNIDSFDNGYFYYGTLPYKLALSQIKYCDGLINSSINEGMSNSILEALYIGCPVYARSNEGNNSIKNIFFYMMIL